MHGDKIYYVYILSSLSRSINTGMTNNLHRRVFEHKRGGGSTHTAKYKITRLVHYETFSSVLSAISREKEIKSWTREKRLQLIESQNLGWIDLAESWFAEKQLESSD